MLAGMFGPKDKVVANVDILRARRKVFHLYVERRTLWRNLWMIFRFIFGRKVMWQCVVTYNVQCLLQTYCVLQYFGHTNFLTCAIPEKS